MVLILSDYEDVSTDYVIEWIAFYNIPFIRLNGKDLSNNLVSLEFKDQDQNIVFNFKGQQVSLSDITGVWFRRGLLNFNSKFKDHSQQSADLTEQIAELLNLENKTLADFIATKLCEKKSLNSHHYNTNKLQVLGFAQQVGLQIPHTTVSCSLQTTLNTFKVEPNQIITKPIQDIFWLYYSETISAQYTVTLQDLEKIPSNFYYSLFQQRIDKKYELRVFFIEDDFYAAAIFSASVDGRHDSFKEDLPRIVPITLENDLLQKLKALARLCKLNSGSIDLIVDKNNCTYFLEINPVGQYGLISKHCHFNLHQRIAKHFLDEKDAAQPTGTKTSTT